LSREVGRRRKRSTSLEVPIRLLSCTYKPNITSSEMHQARLTKTPPLITSHESPLLGAERDMRVNSVSAPSARRTPNSRVRCRPRLTPALQIIRSESADSDSAGRSKSARGGKVKAQTAAACAAEEPCRRMVPSLRAPPGRDSGSRLSPAAGAGRGHSDSAVLATPCFDPLVVFLKPTIRSTLCCGWVWS